MRCGAGCRYPIVMRPAVSSAGADWTTHAVAGHPFGTVGSILPTDGFPATVRVLHPFPLSAGSTLSWRQIADSVDIAFTPHIDSETLL